MVNLIRKIKLKTEHPIQVIDITDHVKSLLAESGVNEGTLNIISQHTTAAININEKEEGLQRDMVEFLRKAVPEKTYIHDRNAVDGRSNTHSHLLAMFANASETIPVAGGRLLLGGWQSIFFIELDGPREERTVVVQVVDNG